MIANVPGLNLRHVEDRVDDREQMLARSMDDRRIFALLVLLHGPQGAAAEHLGKADDRVERGPQLVAHVGEEMILGADRLFAGQVRLFEIDRMLTGGGDIAQNRDDLAGLAASFSRKAFRLHLDPDVAGLGVTARILGMAVDAKPHGPRHRIHTMRGIRDQLQEGRAIGDMDMIE